MRENPITAVRWQKPKVSNQVDPRVVANPEQARNLLAAVSYVGGYRRARGRRLVGLFAAMYFGGLRPAEAVGLAETDLNLPEEGWGSALSTWLNAGVDPTEVAERAGNSVEVLLTRYAKCLDGRQDVANRRTKDLLREYE
jgi:integrase